MSDYTSLTFKKSPAKRYDEPNYAILAGANFDVVVGTVFCRASQVEIPDAEAYAKLFAAAPELLDALKTIDSSWLEDFPDGPDTKLREGCSIGDDHKKFWIAARAAIAKAEGTS